LAALKTIAGPEYSHLWHAALADNLRRLGHTREAAGELHAAVTLAPSEVEQRLLQGPSAYCAVRARLTGFLAFSLSPTFSALSWTVAAYARTTL
jgi:hypothetical protein